MTSDAMKKYAQSINMRLLSIIFFFRKVNLKQTLK